MRFRNIVIVHSMKIMCGIGHITLEDKTKELQVPVDEINSIILDNPGILVSAKTINILSQNHVVVIICNYKHLPSSQILCLENYGTLVPVKMQLLYQKKQKGRLWQKIIKRKIKNQLMTLRAVKGNSKPVIKLKELCNNTTFYDKTHCESVAARIYFKALFGKSFNRRKPNYVNSLLNYGYSLIRSMIARSVIAYNLAPYLSIWHHNRFDNFTLADDLIEPFRGLVDYFICCHFDINNHHKIFSRQDRHKLLKLLTISIMTKKGHLLINMAIDIEVSSYKRCIMSNQITYLQLPEWGITK